MCAVLCLFLEERALYQVEESVDENGFVTVHGKKLLSRDVQDLGACTLVDNLVPVR